MLSQIRNKKRTHTNGSDQVIVNKTTRYYYCMVYMYGLGIGQTIVYIYVYEITTNCRSYYALWLLLYERSCLFYEKILSQTRKTHIIFFMSAYTWLPLLMRS